MILKEKIFSKSTISKNNLFLKSTILRKKLHIKNHILIQFTPLKAQILRFKCIFKKHDFEGKKFWGKKQDFECKIISKSIILNETIFVKSTILNQNFFILSDFELMFLQRVRL